MEKEVTSQSRRELLVDVLRYGALAGLSTFAAAMLVRTATSPGGLTCGLASGCPQCPQLSTCVRPESRQLKQQG